MAVGPASPVTRLPSLRAVLAVGALLLVAAAALLLLTAGRGLADTDSGDVMRVRFGGDAQVTRVVIDMGRSAQGRLSETSGQDLTLALVGVDAGRGAEAAGQGLVRSYRLDSAGGAARLRLNLTRQAQVKRRFLLPPGDGVSHYRYVLDLEASGAGPARSPARESSPTRSNRTQPRVIVVDAGHGGRDPGAQGAEHAEKAITLAAAQALKERLEATGRYRVVLTRTGDSYVPLESRVRIARQAGADLFISLHADAGPSPETRGASVYTLDERGEERAARQVMAGRGALSGVQLPGRDPAVRRVLLDLTQRATQNRSAAFAQVLLTHIEDEAPLLRRSHRNDNFAVLLAPDVPAVLLEMGFITNPEDERLLSSARSRNRLMGAVVEAIDAYFAMPSGGLMMAAAP
ncbi:N-acetylmuramoyl-L-alanine amidase [Brevundimonas sp. 2R-24]|uniref:N-acetylmuramoyl-L-alanine amidase n=1 Tax=Peiella sedimenti TaxID=3061083 RepID=A0ABT8SIQ0_9CAUL|nr:N-acetylmuramoyl-L-alanine amidase [Caulobacteraceae bacterium XZ-24]